MNSRTRLPNKYCWEFSFSKGWLPLIRVGTLYAFYDSSDWQSQSSCHVQGLLSNNFAWNCLHVRLRIMPMSSDQLTSLWMMFAILPTLYAKSTLAFSILVFHFTGAEEFVGLFQFLWSFTWSPVSMSESFTIVGFSSKIEEHKSRPFSWLNIIGHSKSYIIIFRHI